MVIELTKEAYTETPWGTSTIDWHKYILPSKWMEDFAELIEQKLLQANLADEKPDKSYILKEIRRVTRDSTCGARVTLGLKQVYAIVSERVKDDEINFDPKDPEALAACMEKIYERVIHCSAGAENGLNEVLRSWRQPKNLAQRLEKYRTQIMMKLAINTTDEVHGQNQVTRIAHGYDNNKFGIKINSPHDPYPSQDTNFPSSNEIKKRLDNIFQQEYTPLLIMKSLEEQYKEYMYGLGYTGNADDGYTSAVYGPINDYLNKQFGISEDWMLKNGNKIVDVQWSLVRKKIIEQLISEKIITADEQINNLQQILPKISNLEEIKYWCSLNPDTNEIEQWIASIADDEKSITNCMLMAFLPTESDYLKNKQLLIDANKTNYQKIKKLLLTNLDYLKSQKIAQSLSLSFENLADAEINDFFFNKENQNSIFSLLHSKVNSSSCSPMYSLLINKLNLGDYLNEIEEGKRVEVICKILLQASPGADRDGFIQQIQQAVKNKKVDLRQLQNYVFQTPELYKSYNFISSFLAVYKNKQQLRSLLFSKIRIPGTAEDQMNVIRIFIIVFYPIAYAGIAIFGIFFILFGPEFFRPIATLLENFIQNMSSIVVSFFDYILRQNKSFVTNTLQSVANQCTNLNEYQALFKGKYTRIESICSVIEHVSEDHVLMIEVKSQLKGKRLLEKLLQHLISNRQLMDSETFVSKFIAILNSLDSNYLKQNDATIFEVLLPYGNSHSVPKLLELISGKYTMDEVLQKYTPLKKNDFYCLLISYQPEGKYETELENYIRDQPQQLASYLKDNIHYLKRPEFLTNLTKILEKNDTGLKEIIEYEPNLVSICLDNLHPSNVAKFLQFVKKYLPDKMDTLFSKFSIWQKNIGSPEVVGKLLEFMRENKLDIPIPYKKINKLLRHYTENNPSQDATVLQDRFKVQSDLYHHGGLYGTPTTFYSICTKGDVCLLLDSQLLADSDFVAYIERRNPNTELPLFEVIIANNFYSEPLLTKIISLPKAQRILLGKSLSNDNVLMSLMRNKNNNNLFALTSLLKSLSSGSFEDNFIKELFNYPKGSSILTLASSLDSNEPYLRPSFFSVLLDAITRFKPELQDEILSNCKSKEINDVSQRIDLLITKIECGCMRQEDEDLLKDLSATELGTFFAKIGDKPKTKEYIKKLLISGTISYSRVKCDRSTLIEFAKKYTIEEYLSILPKNLSLGRKVCIVLMDNIYPEASMGHLDQYFNDLIEYLNEHSAILDFEDFRTNFLVFLKRQNPQVLRQVFAADIPTVINGYYAQNQDQTIEENLKKLDITSESLIKFIKTNIESITKAPNSNITSPSQTTSNIIISDNDRTETIVPVEDAPVVLLEPTLTKLDEQGYLEPEAFFLESNKDAVTAFYEELEAKEYDFTAYLNLFDERTQSKAVDAILNYDTNQTYIYDAGLMQYLINHDIEIFKKYLTDNDKAFKNPLFVSNVTSIVPALTGEQLHALVQAPLTHSLISFLMKNTSQFSHEIDVNVKKAISTYVHENVQSFIVYIKQIPQLMNAPAFIASLTTILSESEIPEQLSSFIPLYEKIQSIQIAQEAYEKLFAKYQNSREFGALGLKILKQGDIGSILNYVSDDIVMTAIKEEGVKLLVRLMLAKDRESLQKVLNILGQKPLDEELITSLFTSNTEIDSKNYTLITLADSLDQSNAAGTQPFLLQLLDLVGKCSEETQKNLIQSVALRDLNHPDIILRRKFDLNMENILPTTSYELCLLFKKIRYDGTFKQYADLFSNSHIIKNLLNNYDTDTCLLFWQVLSENQSLLNSHLDPDVFTNITNLVALVNDSDDCALDFLFKVIQSNKDISVSLIHELEGSDNKIWSSSSGSSSRLLNVIQFFEGQQVDVPYQSILKNCVMEDKSTQTPEVLKNDFLLTAHLYRKLGYSKAPDSFLMLCKQHDLAIVIESISNRDLKNYIMNSKELITDMLNHNYSNYEILMQKVATFDLADRQDVLKSFSINYARGSENKFKLLKLRQESYCFDLGYWEQISIENSLSNRDELVSVIDEVRGVNKSEYFFVSALLTLIKFKRLSLLEVNDANIKILELVNTMNDNKKRDLLGSFCIDHIRDMQYYKRVIIALKDSIHLLDLYTRHMKTIATRFKDDSEMPLILQLRFKDNPEEIMALLRANPQAFKNFTYTNYDSEHLNNLLKPEHWYEIAKAQLLPLDVLKYKKDAVFEYIKRKSDKAILNDASSPGSSIHALFSTPRGRFETSKSRGTLKKLEDLQQEMERNEKKEPPQAG